MTTTGERAIASAAGPEAVLQPYYFGPARTALFGCYHPAAGHGGVKGGVVICNPMGHEYQLCHRALRQLAVRCTHAGWSVLRFDFFGTGDSAGDSGEGSPSRWLRDVEAAATELARRRATLSGSPPRVGQPAAPVSAVGLRLGATLAFMRGAEHDIDAPLVLWDPVIDGRSYVAELKALHAARHGAAGSGGILGFPFPAALQTELESIDLLKTKPPAARRVLIVESGAMREAAQALARRLTEAGAIVEHRSFPTAAVWQDQPNKGAVPANVIQAIVSWIRQ